MGEGILNDFRKLRYAFTVRSFFTFLFGIALLGGNAFLFVVTTIEMFDVAGSWGWLYFGGGLFAFLISCLLIVICTVHFSVSPQVDARGKEGGIFSDKMPFGSKKGRILAIILLVVITLGGGSAALGSYFKTEAKYKAYPQTTATVVSLVGNSSEDGYTPIYEYTVDGKKYRQKGKIKSSGDGAPKVGDTVSIRYNPNNPNDIHIGTESKFMLGFGCFLIFFGLLFIAFGLHNAKKLRTQFLLAFILLGLTACVFTMFLTSTEFQGIIPFFARNYMLHFVLIFTNVGILELINGIVYIGYKKDATYEE